MRKNNIKKSVLLITLLVLCLATVSCNQATGPSVTDGSTADPSQVETTQQDTSIVSECPTPQSNSVLITLDDIAPSSVKDIQYHPSQYRPSLLYKDSDPPVQCEEYQVPNFLSAEQQYLYIQACSIYPLFRGQSSDIVDYVVNEGDRKYNGIDPVRFENITYVPICGRYRNWNDFESMCLSVFTEDTFRNEINYNPTSFISVDGKTYRINADKDGPWYYLYGQDAFTLVSQSEDEIRFTVTSFYEANLSPEFLKPYKTCDLIMVRTTDGWRFSKFHMSCTE